MVLYVPNVFMHTNIPSKKDVEERVIMKITGVIVEILVELESEIYRNHVVFENLNTVIYVVVLR